VSIRNLHAAFNPRSIALIGASGRRASVGLKLFDNLVGAGFAGTVLAVNPHHADIGGTRVYASIADLPQTPDLAIVATPADTIPQIIHELGTRGCKACVVISAGFAEMQGKTGAELQQRMLDAAKPHLLRIIGPNCIGILVPEHGVNASFAPSTPRPGGIAFVAQSGAVLTAVMDWAAPRDIGFSHVVSLGGMADVDFGDCLDYLANDESTHAILLYIEAVTAPRKFMSAARAAARTKPVIVCKSGRHAESARAAHSHTGALAGSDKVYDAAFRRAGMLRVHTLEQLFEAVEILATTRRPPGDRLAIVTNGGGLGILATDQLIDEGGRLAALSQSTITRLNGSLPAAWSHANPIDILGDATRERYRSTLDVVLNDAQVDAVLVLNCPVALVSGQECAAALLDAQREHPTRTVLASWVGGDQQRASRDLFVQHRIPSYDTPEDAVRAFMYLVNYRRSQTALLETPPATPLALTPDRASARKVVADALLHRAEWLDITTAKQMLAAYEIPVLQSRSCSSPQAAAAAAREFGVPVALKLDSPDIVHKSDLGGVVLDLADPGVVSAAAQAMESRIRASHPSARIRGFIVEPMLHKRDAFELIVGAYQDVQFGPVMLFGHGGVAVEVRNDTALGLPPLNVALAREMMSRTRVINMLQGYRNVAPADLSAVAFTLVRVSQMLIDIPEIVELDINPLVADASGVVALDVRIRIAPAPAAGSARFAIKPYPNELEETLQQPDGHHLLLRPIRPEDEPSLHAAFAKLTPEEIHLRFFVAMRSLPHLLAARFTQIDYDREMALVLTDPGIAGQTEIYGVVRLVADPDLERAEFAVIVRQDWSNMGFGTLLMRRIIEYARSRGIGTLHGEVLRENRRMLTLCRELGFTVTPVTSDPSFVTVALTLHHSYAEETS
jgi:acetyltransferase